jgi:hypothetical protein
MRPKKVGNQSDSVRCAIFVQNDWVLFFRFFFSWYDLLPSLHLLGGQGSFTRCHEQERLINAFGCAETVV